MWPCSRVLNNTLIRRQTLFRNVAQGSIGYQYITHTMDNARKSRSRLTNNQKNKTWGFDSNRSSKSTYVKFYDGIVLRKRKTTWRPREILWSDDAS